MLVDSTTFAAGDATAHPPGFRSVKAGILTLFNMRKLWSDNRFSAALCCVLLLAYNPAGSQHGGNAPLTQRRINEWAAALQRARYALIEETGLRRPAEPLNAYLARIARPQPGESAAGRQERVAGYIDALSAAVAATVNARHLPVLHANDATNLQVWQRAVHDMAALPERVRRLQVVEAAAHSAQVGRPVRTFGTELIEAVTVVLAAYAALRDARP